MDWRENHSNVKYLNRITTEIMFWDFNDGINVVTWMLRPRMAFWKSKILNKLTIHKIDRK